MNVLNRKDSNTDITDYIESHLISDIDKILSGNEIDLGNTEMPEFDEDEVYGAVMTKIFRKPDLLSLAAKWFSAAVLLLGVALTAFYFVKGTPEPKTNIIFADRGEKVIVVLPDGSKVSLNSESRLYYPSEFVGDVREVKISGEAYFEVSSDENNPFIVNTDDMMIKVTGTKFNVKAYPESKHILTTLDEGRISIGKNKENLRLMLPGQCAYFEKSTALCQIKDVENPGIASEWRNNQFVFRNTPISEVLRAAERKFDVDFSISNPEIEKYTYTFSCSANDMNDIIGIMETVTPVVFVRAGDDSYLVK